MFGVSLAQVFAFDFISGPNSPPNAALICALLLNGMLAVVMTQAFQGLRETGPLAFFATLLGRTPQLACGNLVSAFHA